MQLSREEDDKSYRDEISILRYFSLASGNCDPFVTVKNKYKQVCPKVVSSRTTFIISGALLDERKALSESYQ